MSDGHIAIDGTKVYGGLFKRMVNAEDARRGHCYPVMTSPALYHQQEIEVAAVRLIIFLEVIIGLFHKTANLTAQQHLGKNVAAVI